MSIGQPDSGVENGRMWMTCECGGSLSRSPALLDFRPACRRGLLHGPGPASPRPASDRACLVGPVWEDPVTERRIQESETCGR